MSSTAIAERPVTGLAAPSVTPDQMDLIRRTIAKDATPDELKLYLYDCARQGVHPLDKLIHFTKRSGKYTPITSIDFMRIRAADTNEYAGSDAALFAGKDGIWSSLWLASEPPLAALVTVWRIVQGQRCKFEAVARWAEYKPDANDFMWKKMPATMLSKCAEACALRKGFPRQLAGLYAKEELDQADTAPTSRTVRADPPVTVIDTTTGAEVPASDKPEPPEGYHYIHGYGMSGEWHEFTILNLDAQGGAVKFATKTRVGQIVGEAFREGLPIRIDDFTHKKNSPGEAYINKVTVWKPDPTQAELDAEIAKQDMATAAGGVA